MELKVEKLKSKICNQLMMCQIEVYETEFSICIKTFYFILNPMHVQYEQPVDGDSPDLMNEKMFSHHLDGIHRLRKVKPLKQNLNLLQIKL